MNHRRVVVISAVNFTAGGPLTVLRECLASAIAVLPSEWSIIAIINNPDLINMPRVKKVVIPEAKKAWWRRLYWEWFGFNKLSQEWRPDLWLSLHDITPRVQARYRAVYCHNPAPFYSLSLREAILEPKFLLFSLLYSCLYGINIEKNKYVIVQQEWIRRKFLRRFGLLPLIVAYPSQVLTSTSGMFKHSAKKVFLYPALARVFKNHELIGEALNLLAAKGVKNFEVRITIDGSENNYARLLRRQYGNLPNLKFLGLQDADQMLAQYKEASVLLFPSRLETWGLPISEAKQFKLPMLVAEAPYARETVGDFDLVSFFNPSSPEQLAELMKSIMDGTWRPLGNLGRKPANPYAANWDELWSLLIGEEAVTKGI